MKGQIISVFSCVGKTHFVLNNFNKLDCIDHDFYDYRYRGQLGNNWLDYYWSRTLQLQNKFRYIFVNATPEIIAKLPDDARVIFPYHGLKDEYVQRALDRGGKTEFPKLLEEKWEEWIDACEQWRYRNYILTKGEYLTDVPKEIYMTGITCA